VPINTPKATKDIAAGQEIFIWYGDAKWFEGKNLSYADVDYASTMWRPDLHPLPYRRKVAQRTRADGRHSYAVLETIRPGSILEISLCVVMSVVVIDQFPFLWDFVLIGETEHEHTGCILGANRYLPPHTHTPPVFSQIKAKEISGNVLTRFCISFLHSLSSDAHTRNLLIRSPLEHMTWG
jgi:hypothetical protein